MNKNLNEAKFLICANIERILQFYFDIIYLHDLRIRWQSKMVSYHIMIHLLCNNDLYTSRLFFSVILQCHEIMLSK